MEDDIDVKIVKWHDIRRRIKRRSGCIIPAVYKDFRWLSGGSPGIHLFHFVDRFQCMFGFVQSIVHGLHFEIVRTLYL